MNISQQLTITEQYDEVDRRFREALYAIHNSGRSAETRRDLFKKLQDGHYNAPTAAAQLEAIKEVMDELRG
jgi:hypothetical protein